MQLATNKEDSIAVLPKTLEWPGKLEFALGQKVLLREVQRPGKVEAITIDFLGITYRIGYWDNGDRKTVWVPADDLEQR